MIFILVELITFYLLCVGGDVWGAEIDEGGGGKGGNST